MILNRLDIPKRRSECSAGGHPFVAGDKCFTLVSLDTDKWVRQDLCEACWNDLKGRGLPAETKSYWQTVVSLKESEAPLPKHKEERALALLKRFLSSQAQTEEREAYVLALYLARKKFLSLRQEVEQLGETICLYETAETEELLPVKKITLRSNDIDILQKRVADMLTG